MKKSYFVIITVILLSLSSCDQSSGSGKNSGDTRGGGIIDVSNTIDCTIPYNAYSFGYQPGNQAKRFQTFIADTHTNLDAVEVKIRKNDINDTYNDISVELYETDAGLPSAKIAESTIDSSSLGSDFTVKRAGLNYQPLFPGTEYAVVLGQVDLETNTSTNGFEWCTEEVNADLNFGKLEGSTWTDESGSGDGWLKVYVSGGISSSVTSYYAGTITVDVEDTIGTTCFDTFENHATFNILLENDPSFSGGMKWNNSTGVTITGSYLKTSTCQYSPDSISSNGDRTLAKSASDFPVTLMLWDSDKYQLAITSIGFPDCTVQFGSVSSTMVGIIIVPLVEVDPTPADTSHIFNQATVNGPSGEEVKVTYDLTLHSN